MGIYVMFPSLSPVWAPTWIHIMRRYWAAPSSALVTVLGFRWYQHVYASLREQLKQVTTMLWVSFTYSQNWGRTICEEHGFSAQRIKCLRWPETLLNPLPWPLWGMLAQKLSLQRKGCLFIFLNLQCHPKIYFKRHTCGFKCMPLEIAPKVFLKGSASNQLCFIMIQTLSPLLPGTRLEIVLMLSVCPLPAFTFDPVWPDNQVNALGVYHSMMIDWVILDK